MTLYIGVDIHARQQTVSYLITKDGTMGQQSNLHPIETNAQGQSLFVGLEAQGREELPRGES
jgi:hypothetical protein